MNNNEEKNFTAEEVNKIVEERLSRERKQSGSLSALKELLKGLKAEGKLKGESLSELASELMAILGEKAESDVSKAPETEGEAPVAEGKSPVAESEASEIEGDPIVEKFEREQAELKEAFPELDITALLNNDAFCDFYKAYVKEFADATLLEVYGGFMKAKSAEENLRLSTSLKRTPSSQRAADNTEASLTPTQRAIASKAGMSYREYAKLLEEIPKRKIKTS